MAIKIIKKRQVAAPARPAPLVDAAPAAEAPTIAKPLTPYRKPTVCSFCEHPYIEPCHGKSDTCMNAKWKSERLAAQEATK